MSNQMSNKIDLRLQVVKAASAASCPTECGTTLHRKHDAPDLCVTRCVASAATMLSLIFCCS